MSSVAYQTRGLSRGAETVAAWMLGRSGSCRSPTRSGPRSIRASSRRISCRRRRSPLENFAKAWHAAPFARYFLNTDPAVHDGPRRAARAVHAGRVRFRALRVSGPQCSVRPGAGAADGHARCADRRELPHDERAGPARHHPRHRPAVHGERFRHLSAAADVQDGAEGARRGGACRRLHARCRCCGRCMCRWRGRCTLPTPWSA